MTRTRIPALLATLALLGACATTDEMAGGPGAGPLVADSEVVVDQEYVQTVNYIAKKRGLRVVWINPPKKRVDRDTQQQVAGR